MCALPSPECDGVFLILRSKPSPPEGTPLTDGGKDGFVRSAEQTLKEPIHAHIPPKNTKPEQFYIIQAFGKVPSRLYYVGPMELRALTRVQNFRFILIDRNQSA